jgi:hypothetical protein
MDVNTVYGMIENKLSIKIDIWLCKIHTSRNLYILQIYIYEGHTARHRKMVY